MQHLYIYSGSTILFSVIFLLYGAHYIALFEPDQAFDCAIISQLIAFWGSDRLRAVCHDLMTGGVWFMVGLDLREGVTVHMRG
jgi:hypothetical protein